MPIVNYPMINRPVSLLEGFSQGQKIGKNLLMTPLDLKSKELANAIKSVQAKYAEPVTKQQLQHAILNNLYQQQVNTRYGQMTPLEVEKLKQYNQYYSHNMESLIGQRGANTRLTNERADWLPRMNQSQIDLRSQLASQRTKIGDYREQLIRDRKWSELPATAKSGIIAQGMAMGIEPAEMANLVKGGKSLSEIAKEKGFDNSTLPHPQYFPTAAVQTRNTIANQADAELKVMNSMATANITPYAERYAGYSPKQIVDSLSGKNNEQLGKYLAGLAVQQEIANVRNKIAGGESGITATEGMINRSFNNAKTLMPRMPKEVYPIIQNEIDRIISQGLKARNMVGMNPFISSNEEQNISNNSQNSDLEYDPSTGNFK